MGRTSFVFCPEIMNRSSSQLPALGGRIFSPKIHEKSLNHCPQCTSKAYRKDVKIQAHLLNCRRNFLHLKWTRVEVVRVEYHTAVDEICSIHRGGLSTSILNWKKDKFHALKFDHDLIKNEFNMDCVIQTQQTPNPLAQELAAVPPIVVHSREW